MLRSYSGELRKLRYSTTFGTNYKGKFVFIFKLWWSNNNLIWITREF